MEYIYSIILGAIQGLTEFWPISSSGHLVIAHDFFKFVNIHDLNFDVALHMGTLVALVIFFAKDIYKYMLAWFASLANWKVRENIDQRIAWYIFIGTIPAAVVGYFIENLAESVFRNLWLVAGLLIGIGLLFIITERLAKREKSLERMKWSEAVLIGVAQALALVPGVSRSGITILAGLWQGFQRSVAARFSFLLSIPVVFGAGVKKIYDLIIVGVDKSDWLVLLTGFSVSLVVGYFAVRFLLRFLVSHSLNVFAYYRLVLGLAVIIYILVK